MEERQDFVDIEGFDPQLRKHRAALPQEPETCHFFLLTSRLCDRGNRVFGKCAGQAARKRLVKQDAHRVLQPRGLAQAR